MHGYNFQNLLTSVERLSIKKNSESQEIFIQGEFFLINKFIVPS